MEEQENQSTINKVNTWYRELPNKKKYVEFVTAILSVPVLVTVIISNVTNLQNKNKDEVIVSPTPSQIVQYIPVGSASNETKEKVVPSPTVTGEVSPTIGECKKEVGPTDISYPAEGATVTENPVTVVVSYHPGEYCAAVWAYRINGGTWSQYDDKSIALYGMTAGEKRLELKVKSLASGAEVFVTRTFIYEPAEEDTQVQSATSSATPQ